MPVDGGLARRLLWSQTPPLLAMLYVQVIVKGCCGPTWKWRSHESQNTESRT